MIRGSSVLTHVDTLYSTVNKFLESFSMQGVNKPQKIIGASLSKPYTGSE